MKQKLVTIGIGGATCSGKTILAKHLARLLDGEVLHQDDFAPAPDDIPFHPIHTDLRDWDDPRGAVLWPKFRQAVSRAKSGHGAVHVSREDAHTAIPIDPVVVSRWTERIQRMKREQELRFCVIDGFLLYWDKEVAEGLDVRVLLRVDKEILQTRREGRGYLMENGETWRDPPGYFEKIVWPAYVVAHEHIPGALDVGSPSLEQNSDRPLDSDDTDGRNSASISTTTDTRAIGVRFIDVKDGEAGITAAFETLCEEVERYLLQQVDAEGKPTDP